MSQLNKNTVENWKKHRKGNEDVIEEFCMACLSIPLAFAGVGASAYGASSRKKYKTQKKVALWGGIIAVILSLIIGIYYLYSCKDCR